MIDFNIEGPGEIVATDNGDPADLVAFFSAKRAAYSGLTLAIVKSKKGAKGVIKVNVHSKGLVGTQVEVIRK
jgi:beta-galactosidase